MLSIERERERAHMQLQACLGAQRATLTQVSGIPLRLRPKNEDPHCLRIHSIESL